jgi:hypothetical protein
MSLSPVYHADSRNGGGPTIQDAWISASIVDRRAAHEEWPRVVDANPAAARAEAGRPNLKHVMEPTNPTTTKRKR